MVRTVLIPIDDSDRSTEALRFAFDAQPDAQFVALHVREPIYGGLLPHQSGGDEAVGDEVEELLDRARGVAEEHGVSLETVTAEGKPSAEIVDYAEDNPVDSIVMGSHGRQGASRVLLGSVAETVTRRSPVPVTVVR